MNITKFEQTEVAFFIKSYLYGMKQLVGIITMFFVAMNIISADGIVFTPINVSHGLSDNQIRYILQLPNGQMVFTTSGTLNLYDGARFKYIHRTSSHIYSLNEYDGFYRIYQGGDSLLWIKDTHKLMCVDLYQEKYISDLSSYFKNKGVEGVIDDFFIDRDCHWWYSVSGKLHRQDTSETFDILTNKGKLQDLSTDNHNLYLFYNTGEIICYDLNTKKKLYTYPAYKKEDQVLFKNTSLIIEADNGFYQLRNGSKGGFFFFDKEKLKWEKLLETDYTLNILIVAPGGTAYISCVNGIWIINRDTGYKQYLPILRTVDGNVIKTEVSTLFHDKQGGLWLGTLNQGLLYYHPSRYKFTYIGRSYFHGYPTEDVIVESFAEDDSGNIYVKCQFQTYKYNLLDTNLSLVHPSELPENVSNVLTWKSIISHTDIRGWEWIGTPDGLRLIKPNEQKEKIFYTEDGLSNNFVHAILEDRKHDIWVTTSYGISKVIVDSADGKIHFVNFNTFDGTLDGEYIDGSAFEASDGTLYFGGVNGFNVLKPENISSAQLPFRPLFTNLFLHGQKVEIGNKYNGHIILPKAASYVKEIELLYNQNFLSFEFSALNYQNPSQTRYRYQLEGIDKNWIEASIGNEEERNGILRLSYTGLPPGEYILKVMSAPNNNQWIGPVTELHIRIHAPWWQTNTAYVLYLLFFITAVFLSFYLYTYFTRRRIVQQHKEEVLLLRVRNLIEQCNLLEAEKESYLLKKETDGNIFEDSTLLRSDDSVFLSKAMELVEKNLNEPNYSVEQLSKDLCMDRTGLYRKLIALLDKSPSLFIRSIRLQKAAQLILEGNLSISEIAENVGFSSSSYLSKCFQEMYSCRPSEYAEKVKKST